MFENDEMGQIVVIVVFKIDILAELRWTIGKDNHSENEMGNQEEHKSYGDEIDLQCRKKDASDLVAEKKEKIII